MSTQIRIPDNLRNLLQFDEQALLVLQINALAYQINQASIADVKISQTTTMVHVVVKRHFQEVPQISATFGIADAELKMQGSTNMTPAILIMRMRSVVHDLQNILNEGPAPHNDAA